MGDFVINHQTKTTVPGFDIIHECTNEKTSIIKQLATRLTV